jgi:hypothetical protein
VSRRLGVDKAGDRRRASRQPRCRHHRWKYFKSYRYPDSVSGEYAPSQRARISSTFLCILQVI